MPGFAIPLILLVIVIALIAGYFAWKAEQERKQALASMATELGFRFVEDRDGSHDDEYAHFEIFRKGHSRYAYNTLWGTLDVDDCSLWIKMGDFTYKVTTGSGKDRRTTTYRFSYLISELPWKSVPTLLIRPEGIFDKLAGAFGFDDIDFESAEFSRRFHVKSSDKRFAYDVIDPRMMGFLLDESPPLVDIEHGRCCLSDGRSRWQPEQFRSHLDWLLRFIDRWPDHVKASLAELHVNAAQHG